MLYILLNSNLENMKVRPCWDENLENTLHSSEEVQWPTIRHVNEYPAKHYFGNPERT